MEPTLYPSSHVLVCEFPFIPIRRGTIIVFRDWMNPREYVIKRVKYLPGQTFTEEEGIHTTLTDEEYWVEGDNLDNSSDSREWGPVFKHQILGVVVN